jgi:predicted acylesterase/phospholipase RssA
VPDPRTQDVAVVLSGGGINGVLLELGFLKRLREDVIWPRIGWIYGTSAGALAGTMAALDRLDELEEFLLALRPEEVFRLRRLWQFPLGGLHDYTLPETIAARLGDDASLGAALAASEIELVVFATDVSEPIDGDRARDFELVFSSRATPHATMGRAIFASAAISAIVLPIRVGDAVATDGGWVRNFPLEHAYRNPSVATVAAFRYVSTYPAADITFVERVRERLEHFRAVPPVRALLSELHLAEERWQRGEPAHYPELIARLMRVAINRNTFLDERFADERDASVRELHRLHEDVIGTALAAAPLWRRRRLRRELAERFAAASFPFDHDRRVRRVVVNATAGDDALESTFRGEPPWPEESKHALIARGYRLTDEELSRSREELSVPSEGRQGPGQAVGPHAGGGSGPGVPGPDRD